MVKIKWDNKTALMEKLWPLRLLSILPLKSLKALTFIQHPY